MIFLDSTVFIYASIEDYTEHPACLEELQNAIISDDIAVNVIVLSECYHILSKEHKIDRNDVSHRLQSLLKSRKVRYIKVTPDIFERSMEIEKEFEIRINDAIVCACMEKRQVRKILSTDEGHFGRVPWITVKNPIS